MIAAGQVQLQVSAADINTLLHRIPRGGIHFSQGQFQIEQPLPVGGTATCLALAYQQGQELHIAVPFDKIKGTGLGMFAGAMAKTFWGALSTRLQQAVDESLVRRGLPREAVTLTQTTLREGQKGGLIRISLFHLNLWLAKRALREKVIFQIESVAFTAENMRAGLRAHRLEPR